jgi:C_GCAxxG_C_C family probable redox protein
LEKKLMNKTRKALSLFDKGYNCAQAVLMACAGENESAAKAAAAFGGGMGRLQKTCGAVTGAYLWFGMSGGAPGIPDEEDKTRVYGRVREFNRLFIERNGTDQCSELLGEDLNTPEGKMQISARNLTEKVCEKCIADAIGIIESIS